MEALVDAYLLRLGFDSRPEPTRASLEQLVTAHLFAVPFENIDVVEKRPIVLATPALVEKVARRRRGGFCFEVNEAFRALLESLGFAVQRIEGQVWLEREQRFGPAFDHLALQVALEGEVWLVDVAFGDNNRRPLRLPADTARDVSGDYRLSRQADGSGLLERRRRGVVTPLYRFTPEPRALADFAEMCAFHQTSSDSVFTRGLICTLPTTSGRVTLTETRLIEQTDGRRTETPVNDPAQRRAILRDRFGIDG
jgi:N-hydroxyarylamine O-acetyltransferase